MAMPGKNCPDKLTKISGMAKLNTLFQVHSGAMNCGIASEKFTSTGFILPPAKLKATPTTNTHTIAYLGLKRLASKNTSNMPNTITGMVSVALNSPKPN